SHSDFVRFSLENFFEDSEFSLSVVSDKDMALKLLKSEKFDAAIANIDTDPQEGFQLRAELRQHDNKLPLLFMTPLFNWSDSKLLDRIVDDPHSYYIPESADRKFMIAKLRQVIGSCRSETALNQLKSRITRNWFLASLLQQAMLPPWVHFSESYEFSCFYKPFTKVSGDLFEWFPLDDDRALFIFGDVSGHGTHSALAMTAIQSFLTQVVMRDRERATRPCLIASDINDFFCQHLHNIVYMSTLIAYIDFKNNHLRYQNAGFLDIICVNAKTGEIENINPENRGSMPLGMVNNTVYTDEDNVEYNFNDSSVFLFCSDGLMDLSKDAAGERPMDMKMATKLAGILVKDTQREEKTIALPFRYYHSLEQFGYVYPQDDLSLVVIRKPMLSEREYVFSCRVPADKKAVDEICQKASEFVSKFYDSEELSVNVELLLEEYLDNVILHGLNEYEKLNEYIAIKICAYDQEVKLIIWDHGKEWNGLFLPQEKAEQSLDDLNAALAPHGRGVPIISKIATQISRQRYCGLNESIFIIPRNRTRSART
ncbi:MAG: SpoIIE family protein phosphatase, partial [Lentisphaeria bacterium]|nr:SpoIIE family protein phosphatase [Lentisphaeria bacterium]